MHDRCGGVEVEGELEELVVGLESEEQCLYVGSLEFMKGGRRGEDGVESEDTMIERRVGLGDRVELCGIDLGGGDLFQK